MESLGPQLLGHGDQARADAEACGIRSNVELIDPVLVDHEQCESLAIFGFVGAWGDFLWPLLVLQAPETYTLPLGVANLAGTFSANWRLIAAGAVLSIVPVLAVFMALQRYFVAGAAAGAVKG